MDQKTTRLGPLIAPLGRRLLARRTRVRAGGLRLARAVAVRRRPKLLEASTRLARGRSIGRAVRSEPALVAPPGMSEFAARWVFGEGDVEGIPFAGGAAVESDLGPPTFLQRAAEEPAPTPSPPTAVRRGHVEEVRAFRISRTPAPAREPEPEPEPEGDAYTEDVPPALPEQPLAEHVEEPVTAVGSDSAPEAEAEEPPETPQAPEAGVGEALLQRAPAPSGPRQAAPAVLARLERREPPPSRPVVAVRRVSRAQAAAEVEPPTREAMRPPTEPTGPVRRLLRRAASVVRRAAEPEGSRLDAAPEPVLARTEAAAFTAPEAPAPTLAAGEATPGRPEPSRGRRAGVVARLLRRSAPPESTEPEPQPRVELDADALALAREPLEAIPEAEPTLATPPEAAPESFAPAIEPAGPAELVSEPLAEPFVPGQVTAASWDASAPGPGESPPAEAVEPQPESPTSSDAPVATGRLRLSRTPAQRQALRAAQPAAARVRATEPPAKPGVARTPIRLARRLSAASATRPPALTTSPLRLAAATGAAITDDGSGVATVTFPSPPGVPSEPGGPIQADGATSPLLARAAADEPAAADSPPPAPAAGTGTPGTDVDELYEQVVERLRRDLIAERDRWGDLLTDLM